MNRVVLRPLRFTADVEAERSFLETVGLRPRIESERGGWVDLVAGAGMIALHDAASSEYGAHPGRTTLSFEADDVDELAGRLQAAGFGEPAVWDEAYGRVLSVEVGGERIWVDERSEDLYGYRTHGAVRADERLAVTPILYVAEPALWQRFLHVLGGDSAGLVCYQPAADGLDVRLAFRTGEPLDGLLARLGQYEATRGEDELVVTDPDGQQVRIVRADLDES